MPHFFIGINEKVDNQTICITDSENYRHIARALRARAGEKLLLIDENQIQYESVVNEITNKEITVCVENSYKSCIQYRQKYIIDSGGRQNEQLLG